MAAMRTYRQNCGIARALDLLGERWTILIVRELARGPKRFGDLVAGLEGIGTNLLAARLRAMQDAGLVEAQTLPPPAGVSAYALTDHGRSLVPVLEDLALWGMGIPWEDQQHARSRAAWAAMTMRAQLERSDEEAPDGIYEFDVGGEQFWLRIAGGVPELTDGPAPIAPDVRVTCELPIFMELAMGLRRASDTALDVHGDRRRLAAVLRGFRMPAAEPGAGPSPAAIADLVA